MTTAPAPNPDYEVSLRQFALEQSLAALQDLARSFTPGRSRSRIADDTKKALERLGAVAGLLEEAKDIP